MLTYGLFHPDPFVATEPSKQHNESASIQKSLDALVAKYPACEVIWENLNASTETMVAYNRMYFLITRFYSGAAASIKQTLFEVLGRG